MEFKTEEADPVSVASTSASGLQDGQAVSGIVEKNTWHLTHFHKIKDIQSLN